jgi:hypothetical protein
MLRLLRRGMIRVYARENATQRGNSSTAMAGSVASAIRFLAKALMTDVGLTREITRDLNITRVREHFVSNKGIDDEIITNFLHGVPGITENSVRQQLANLKAPGDYARIITEVSEEIEKENREALKALE